jgi:hypothetical protein
LLVLPLVLIACYAAAASSWNLLERPFLRGKQFFESKPVRFDRAAGQYVAG